MINFTVKFQSGIPIYEQVMYAVKKAIVSKQLRPGDRFPSVSFYNSFFYPIRFNTQI